MSLNSLAGQIPCSYDDRLLLGCSFCVISMKGFDPPEREALE